LLPIANVPTDAGIAQQQASERSATQSEQQRGEEHIGDGGNKQSDPSPMVRFGWRSF
jgi:hypothetical protein